MRIWIKGEDWMSYLNAPERKNSLSQGAHEQKQGPQPERKQGEMALLHMTRKLLARNAEKKADAAVGKVSTSTPIYSGTGLAQAFMPGRR